MHFSFRVLFFLIDSCKALLIIYHVKWRYIKWKLLLLLTTFPFNPFTAVSAHRALIDFTLSNARLFYSSVGKPLAAKGLTTIWINGVREDIDGYTLTQHFVVLDSSNSFICSAYQ